MLKNFSTGAHHLQVRVGGRRGKKAESDVTINQQAVEADRRLDSKFVPTTNTSLAPTEVAKTYKGLWRVAASAIGVSKRTQYHVNQFEEGYGSC